MIPVKICGITNVSDAKVCAKYGATALGFIFAPSKRQVQPEQVREITRQLPPFITKIGVFVDEDPMRIKEILRDCQLDLAQLHGEESPEDAEILDGRAIKAFKAGRTLPDPIWQQTNIRAILIDTFSPQESGGTGVAFDWRLMEDFRPLGKPLILAGGLKSVNILEAIRVAQPDAVDISSGVEDRPGIKDARKIAEFMMEINKWNHNK